VLIRAGADGGFALLPMVPWVLSILVLNQLIQHAGSGDPSGSAVATFGLAALSFSGMF
jgi:hypothetical protein